MPRLLSNKLSIECGCVALVGPYGQVAYYDRCEEHDATSRESLARVIWAPFDDMWEVEFGE